MESALKTTERIFIRNQIRRSVFYSPAGMFCVFEYLSKRDLMLFALAFVVAGCLIVWTIDLSIDRLLYADWERQASSPKVHVQIQQDRPVCREGGLEISRMTTSQFSAETVTPCDTAEVEAHLHIGLR
jgi:hypothetical protein